MHINAEDKATYWQMDVGRGYKTVGDQVMTLLSGSPLCVMALGDAQ